jgi:hypothetical protein
MVPGAPLDRRARVAPVGAARGGARRLPRSLLAAAFLILAFHFLEFPFGAYDTGHDLSSAAAFAYYTAKDFQFGVDVYQNAGPLAHVHHSYVYSGLLHGPRVLVKCLLRVALAGLVLWAVSRFGRPLLGLAWLASFVVLYPIGDDSDWPYVDTNEGFAYLTVYLGGLLLLSGSGREGARRWAAEAAVLAILSGLALMKHTLLVLSVGVVGVASLAQAARGERADAARLLVVAVGSITLAWRLTGQQLVHLPDYLRGVFWFAQGYNEAMALPAPPVLGGLAAGVVLLMMGASVWNGARGGISPWLALVNVSFGFVLWKHAIVRADAAHLSLFFLTAIYCGLLFCFASDLPSRAGAAPRVGGRLAAGTAVPLVLLSLAGLWLGVPECQYRPQRLAVHWRHNAAWLAAPAARRAELEAELRAARERHELPRVKALVGGSSIDQFGYQPGWVLLNGLAYRPRPMPISFAASNAALLERNAAFYRGVRAPEFVLSRVGAIDGRLAAQDDGLALAALFECYHPVLREGPVVLLRKNPLAERLRAEWRPLRELRVRQGEAVPVADLATPFVWTSVRMEPTWLGRLRSLLYQPAAVRITVDLAEGGRQARRFVTSMGETPFLIDPLIEDNADLLDAYLGRSAKRVRSFSVGAAGRTGGFFRDEVIVRLLAGPRPPSGPTASGAPVRGAGERTGPGSPGGRP